MNNYQSKIIRITTVPQSLRRLLKGQLKFISENGFEVVGISSSGEVLDEVKSNEGIRVIPVNMTRTISPLKDLKSVWQLYRIFRKEKPAIVHTHTPKAGTVGLLAARLAGVPYRLHTVAGLPLLVVKGIKRQVLDFVEKITYSCATKVYPNSLGLHEIIVKNKLTKQSKLKVIGNGSSNGINTAHFNLDLFSDKEIAMLKRKLNIEIGEFVFIFVGRLVGDKGINELVAAFSKLKSQFNVKLLLVGTFETELDPLRAETLGEIEANPNIISVGFQNDVRPYFAIGDVLAFPSYREGFPNVVMQAGAMGLPSIVTDINGCNEIIIEGENGIIIPPKNAEALQKAMQSLLENRKLTQKLAEKARQLIVSRYEQELVWAAILKEYKSLEENV